MLDVLRQWKWGIRIILGLVVISFIIFYAGSFADFSNNDPSRHMAAVGDQKIENTEFVNTLRMLKEQQKQFMPEGQDSNPQMEKFFRQQAIQSLVDRKLLLKEAKKAGITASDQEVIDQIRKYPFFQQNGQFVEMAEYKRIVEYGFNMDIPTFEKTIAEDIILNKFNNTLTSGLLATDKEVEEEYRKANLTAKIDYVLFESKPHQAKIEVKPEDVRAYYESHKKEFETGELRKVQYLLISSSSEKNRVQIPESRLKEYYDANSSRYSRPEQVQARHILLKIEGGKTEEQVKKQAEDLVKQLRAGADFAALAKQYSEDPGSKENGGDLGLFGRGRMVPEFEQAAFSQQVNEIGDPVKSQFGYHIIQVTSKQPGFTMDFAMVKDQIYRELAGPEATKNAAEQAKKIHEEITKNKKKMSDIAKLQLLELKTTDFFSRTQDIPGLSPNFREKAFQLKKGEVSESVPVFQDFAVLQVLETKPSEIPPFEKVQAKATEKYREAKAQEMAAEEAQKFRASVGMDFKAAAEAMKLTVKSSEPFNKSGYVGELGNDKNVSEKPFEMSVGDISQPQKVNNNFVVYKLVEKKEFDGADFAKQRGQLRQQLISQKQGSFLQNYRSMLRKKYEKDIWINEEAVGGEG